MGRSEISLWVLIRRYDLLEPGATNVQESLQQVTLSTGLTFDELKNLVYSWANVDECHTRVLKIRKYDHNLVPLSSLLHGSSQERPFIIDIVSVHQFCPAEKRTLPIGYIEALKSKLNYLEKRVQIAESEVQNVATIHYNAVEDAATQLVNCVRFLVDNPAAPKKLKICVKMATRWGILSAGKISHDFTAALSTLSKSEHTVVAVAAKDLSRAQQFGKLHGIPTQYGSYQQLAEDKNIDVVYIGSLNTTHLQDAKLMLDHGKNVICEKPLTLNLKQTKELLDYAKSKNLFLMEAVWSRCNPIYHEVKKRIAQGVIGDVYQIICTFGFAIPHVDRLMKKSMGGGTILDLGVYPLQLVSYIFDEEKPVAVKAAGHLNSDGVDESMSATLIYKNARTATIATHAQVNLPNEALIIGTKGIIKIPSFWAPTRAEFPDGSVFEKPAPVAKIDYNFVNSGWLSCEAAEVRECLLKGLKESTKVPHKVSLLLAELEDELRRQLGVVYDVD